MSLDVTLTVTRPTDIYSANITHNLGKMASAVKVGVIGDMTLYDVLWRPEEHNLKYAGDLLPFLSKGLEILMATPNEFKQHNPLNGWGDYDGLVRFVNNYRLACWENPEAEVSVCR